MLACCAVTLSTWLATAGATAAEIRLPEGPGVNLVYSECRTCHDLQYVVDAKGLLPAQWKAVIASMRDYGYVPAADVQAQLLTYLTTYLGAGAPPAPADAKAVANVAAMDGREIFTQNCASCHGAEGHGQPGYYPPLAGNPDLARDRLLPVLVVLHGLSGSIDIAGKTFAGSMPPFDHLSDADVAAVANYVSSAWGNAVAGPGKIDAASVATERRRAMTPADVLAYRNRALPK